MAIVLSHSTARAFYRLQSKPLAHAWPNGSDLLSSAPHAKDLEHARHYLLALGLREFEPGGQPIDLLVFRTHNRRALPGCSAHLNQSTDTNENILYLEDGLCIVSIELCALQAATEMDFPELVEYYFELCSAYTLPIEGSGEYRERAPLTSVQALTKYFKNAQNAHGAKYARRAIAYVRDGSRSPLETAFAMTICLPRPKGGLNVRGFDVDHHVAVTPAARQLTRRRFFYFDAYLPRSKTDLEYNGFYHDAAEVQAIDEERKNALSTMGYGVISINRHVFFDQASFARVMVAIMRREGIRPSGLPQGFYIDQERLRRFVLRRYLDNPGGRQDDSIGRTDDFFFDVDAYYDDMQFQG